MVIHIQSRVLGIRRFRALSETAFLFFISNLKNQTLLRHADVGRNLLSCYVESWIKC